MAKVKWKLTENIINGESYYSVVRLRDIYQFDHSGNCEYAMGWTKDRSEAERKLEELQK